MCISKVIYLFVSCVACFKSDRWRLRTTKTSSDRKKCNYSKSAHAGILIFTVMKFAHIDLSYLVEKPGGTFLFTKS